MLKEAKNTLVDAEVNLNAVTVINYNIDAVLQRDLQKMNRVDEMLEEINSDSKLANKQFKGLIGKVVKNKTVMWVIFVVTILFLVLTVWDMIRFLTKK